MASTLSTFHYTIGGTLTDADTVTLAADPAVFPVNFGLRRVGDGAIIVAAGAATVHAGTGLYTYDHGPLGLAPDQSYLLSFRGVKAAQPDQYATVSIAASTGVSTLRNLRRLLASKIDSLILGRAGIQAAPPLGAYVGVASGTDAKRRLVSTDLAMLDRSGVGEPSAVWAKDGTYLYLPGTGEQRRVTGNGYTANELASTVTDQGSSTERVGCLVPMRQFGTVIPAGAEYEIHLRYPPKSEDGLPGLHDLINEALRNDALAVVGRIALTAVANQRRYDLSAYPWLTRRDQVKLVLNPEPTGGLARRYTGDWALRFAGGSRYLELSSTIGNAGDTFYLDVERPAWSWIRTGGVWADSSFGLVNETDEVDLPPDVVTQFALYLTARRLSQRDPRGEETRWTSEATRALQAIAEYENDPGRQRVGEPVESWGTSSGWPYDGWGYPYGGYGGWR